MTTGRTKSPCAFIVKARQVVLLAALSGAMPVLADDMMPVAGKKLPIRLLKQAKDTKLLFPELPSSQETGPHAWNKAHTWNSPADKEGCAICKANCGPASIAMVAAYYGGRVSQDRLRYEIYGSRIDPPYFVNMWTCWGGGAGDVYPYCNPFLVTGKTVYEGQFTNGAYSAKDRRTHDNLMVDRVGSFCIDPDRAYCDWDDVVELFSAKE